MTMMMGEFIRNAIGREGVASGKARVTGTPLMDGIPGEHYQETRATLAPPRVMINILVTIKIMMYSVNYAIIVCVIVPTSGK